MSHIEISSRDQFTMYGEESVHLHSDLLPKRAATWPDVNEQSSLRSREPMVARLDGVVAGRAFLETELYPFAELQNLYVAPFARGKAVGDAVTADFVRRASELGYVAIHLQTELDNKIAQSLYAKHGFLPAQQGEMLRMIRFLNLPLLSEFLSKHPLVRFDSRSAGDGLWLLEWTDFLSEDVLRITLTGGSCQRDSGGFAPGVAGVDFRMADTAFHVNVSGPDEVRVGEEFALQLDLRNEGQLLLEGITRLLLNPGFAPGGGSTGLIPLSLEPRAETTAALPVNISTSFDTDFWKRTAYSSVGVGVQVIANLQDFWVVKQVKVIGL